MDTNKPTIYLSLEQLLKTKELLDNAPVNIEYARILNPNEKINGTNKNN